MNLLVSRWRSSPASRCSAARCERAPSTLDVFAAASLTEAFPDWAQSLEQRHPGLTVRFNFAGSQQLALQIEQGAPADVFASADQRWMDYARRRARWRASRWSSPAIGWS